MVVEWQFPGLFNGVSWQQPVLCSLVSRLALRRRPTGLPNIHGAGWLELLCSLSLSPLLLPSDVSVPNEGFPDVRSFKNDSRAQDMAQVVRAHASYMPDPELISIAGYHLRSTPAAPWCPHSTIGCDPFDKT